MSNISLKVYGIIENQGKILLVQDFVGKHGWKCVGGHVEAGETLDRALQREALEEVQLPIHIGSVFYTKDFFRPEGSENYHLRMFFHCTADQESFVLQEGEIAKARWFSQSEANALLESELYVDHREAIATYLKKGSGSS